MRSNLLFLSLLLIGLGLNPLKTFANTNQAQALIVNADTTVNTIGNEGQTIPLNQNVQSGEDIEDPDPQEEVAVPEQDGESENPASSPHLTSDRALAALIREGCSSNIESFLYLDEKLAANAISYCDYKQGRSPRFLWISPEFWAIIVTLIGLIVTEAIKWNSNGKDRVNDFRLKAADIISKSGNTFDARLKMEALKKTFPDELEDLSLESFVTPKYTKTYEALQSLVKKDGMTDYDRIDNLVSGMIEELMLDKTKAKPTQGVAAQPSPPPK